MKLFFTALITFTSYMQIIFI